MELPQLIRHMLEPQFYPHPVSLPIQLLQTHISYVFLTGDYAYKVKKALDLGFLDFRTLDQRRHFCYEELRLNQRLSPKLYLDVMAITEEQGRFVLNEAADSKVVEYALRMRQFPQEDLFSKLFERQQLTENHMRTLAGMVADFHRTAATDSKIREGGSVESIRSIMDGNYKVVERFVDKIQPREQFESIRHFAHEFLNTNREWFARRQREDRIRECHGDLHLNNICMYEGEIQIFDCVEFSSRYRNIDVMYEIAFLLMDLDFRGRPDLGNLFMNEYIEQSGDYWGVVLLPFYSSLRATVRAKVDSILWEEPTISEGERHDVLARVKRYHAAAEKYAVQRAGKLFLMSGFSGSGKTTVARKIAKDENAILIRSDAARKHLAGVSLKQKAEKDYDTGIYTPEMTRRTYDRMLELGAMLALSGWPVVLDGTYSRREFRKAAIHAAFESGFPIRIYHCIADDQTIRGRIEARSGDISDFTSDLLDEQKRQWQPFTDAEQPFITTVDTRSQSSL